MYINKSEVSKKLKQLKSIISKKEGTIQGVLYKNGYLIANNLDIAIKTKIETEIETEFVIPLDAIELIANLPTERIEIIPGEKNLTIKSGNGEYAFASINANDFPVLPDTTNSELMEFDSEKILYAMNKVLFACADVGNPTFNGVLLRGNGSELDIVGCDGYRLAWATLAYPIEIDVIIPKSTIQKLSSLGVEGTIKITKIENKIVFETETYTVFSQLIAGKFIDYKTVFPKKTNYSFNTDKKELINLIKRALICIGNFKLIPITLQTDNGAMIIKADTSVSSFNEKIYINGSINDGLKIGLNPRYMLDCLNTLEQPTVSIELSNGTSPLVFKEDNFNSLLLPVRTKEA